MTIDAGGDRQTGGSAENRQEERRRFERKPITVEIEFDGGSTVETATTREIGLGGLYMATNTDLRVNALLKLKFRLGGETIAVDGIVVYQDKGEGVGIRFHNLDKNSEATLKRELPAIETAGITVKRR